MPAAESHEGTAKETAENHADEEDETAMEAAWAVLAPLSTQPTARRVAHALRRAWCEACGRGRGRDAGHKRLAAEQDHLIDAVSVDHVFFAEH